MVEALCLLLLTSCISLGDAASQAAEAKTPSTSKTQLEASESEAARPVLERVDPRLGGAGE